MVPMNVRSAGDRLAMGNKISSLFVHLPVAASDPAERYRLQVEEAEALKAGTQHEGSSFLLDLGNHMPPVLHSFVARSLFATRLFNVTVTNVPGPQTPLYYFGSQIEEIWPLVPIAAVTRHRLGGVQLRRDPLLLPQRRPRFLPRRRGPQGRNRELDRELRELARPRRRPRCSRSGSTDRGGQGVVTAAEMLSIAAFEDGKHAQAFPTFGSERDGRPGHLVLPDRRHGRSASASPISEPDALIIQDPTLLHQVKVFSGLSEDGYVLINTSRSLRGSRARRVRRRLPPRAPARRAGERDREPPARSSAPQHCPARRLRGDDGRSHAGGGRPGDRAEVLRATSQTATCSRPTEAHDFVQREIRELTRA